MPNPLLNTMQMPSNNNQNGSQNGNDLMKNIQQFQSMINGNPQQIVQNLLASGRMSQAQFQQYSQMANQILGLT